MLAATRLIIFLRGQDFRSFGVESRLSLPSAYPYCLMGPLKEGLSRSTGQTHLTDRQGSYWRVLSLMMAPVTLFLTIPQNREDGKDLRGS